MGVTVEAGGSKQHKIIEAGRDCGRGKDPASRGMVLGWDSDTCEETDVEEEVEEMEEVAASCSDITSNQELSNADQSNEDHSVEVTSIDSIDRGLETEAVNHIETEVSGGAPAPAPGLSLVLLILSFSYSL